MSITITKRPQRVTIRRAQVAERRRFRVSLRRERLEQAPAIPTGMAFDPVKLEASVCRDSFYTFVQRFWDVVVNEKPVWNWHIKEICDILQAEAERVFRGEPKLHDLVINIPPGTTKSLMVSVMWPAWIWTRMPTAKILSTSHTHELAIDFSTKSRDLVKSEKWIKLFGIIETTDIRADQDTKHYYKNKAGGWRYATGVTGDPVGKHAHFIIIDDPIDPRGALSEAEMLAANSFITQTLATRKVDKEIALTILVMQRLHQNDPSAVLLKEAKKPDGTPVKHVLLPGVVDGLPIAIVRPRKFARFYVKGEKGKYLLDPVRLSPLALKRLESILGQYGYSGQILQNPIPPGGGMFKTVRMVLDEPPPLRHMRQLCRYWDKAGTDAKENAKAAYTAGVLMGEDEKGQFWILDVIRGQWDSGEREDRILQTAQKDTSTDPKLLRTVVVGLEQEPGSGGKESARLTAKCLRGFRVRITRPTGNKVMRADPFSVQCNAGNVRVNKNGRWVADYIDEIENFPNSTYKDQVDASSGAFTILTREVTHVGAAPKKGHKAA